MGKWSKFHTGLLLCIFLFIGIGLIVLPPDREEHPPYVSFSPAPDGTKAVKLWLEENGIPIREWNQSWRFLPQDGNHTVVLIQPFTAYEEEQEWMLEWIAAGNELLLFAEEPIGWPLFSLQDVREGPEDNAPNIAEGARGQHSEEEEMEWLGNAEESEAVVRTIASPQTGEEYRGRVDTYYRLDIEEDEDTEILLTDEEGVLAMKKTIGEGKISVFLTPSWLLNEHILDYDHLAMVQPLLNRDFKALWVDEYHHGYQEDPGIWAVYPAVLLIMAIQVVLAVLLWLWWKGKRFGRAFIPRQWRVRRGDETLLAVASWYERGRLRTEALGHQEDYVSHLLREKWGAGLQWSVETIGEVAEERWGPEEVQQLKQVWQSMQNRKRQSSISNKQFLQESDRINHIIDRLEKE